MTPAPISVERLRELLAFLDGSGQLDGRNFGDDGPIINGIRRNYWWRADLRHITALLHQLAEREAEVAELREVRDGLLRDLATTTDTLAARAEAAERAREGDRAALAKLERECRTYQGQHENAYVDHQRDGRESYHPGRAIANTFKWMGDRIAAFLAASGEK